MRDFIKKVSILFIILFLSVPLALMGQILGSAAANEGGSTIEVGGNTKITQNGCSRKIEKTEKISWRLPRKPVDLVILQDASGSFKNTIPNVQNALKTLTTFVKEEEYDENNPRLVKTDNPDTSDRVMMATFQGADGYNYYYNNDLQVVKMFMVVGDLTMITNTRQVTCLLIKMISINSLIILK